MEWDDITTPWDRLTIWQGQTSWGICAEAEWPDGSRSDEALFNLPLDGVLYAIWQRGPYVGQVVWRRPAEFIVPFPCEERRKEGE